MTCVRDTGNIKHAGNEVISGDRFILVGFYNADGRDRAGEEVSNLQPLLRWFSVLPSLARMGRPPTQSPLPVVPPSCCLTCSPYYSSLCASRQCYFNKKALEEQRQMMQRSPPGANSPLASPALDG